MGLRKTVFRAELRAEWKFWKTGIFPTIYTRSRYGLHQTACRYDHFDESSRLEKLYLPTLFSSNNNLSNKKDKKDYKISLQILI
jgi:hypothetical protein